MTKKELVKKLRELPDIDNPQLVLMQACNLFVEFIDDDLIANEFSNALDSAIFKD